MLSQDVIIAGGSLLIVWIMLIVLRVPSSVAMLGVLVGQVISAEIPSRLPYNRWWPLGLLIAPMLTVMLLARGRINKSKILLELIGLLCVAVSMVILSYPLIDKLQSSINIATEYKFHEYSAEVLSIAVFLAMVIAVFVYPKNDKHDKKHH